MEKVLKIVEPKYKELPDNFWYHGWPHVERVVKNSKKISNLEKVDCFPCEIAAYCHDLGRIIEAQQTKEDVSLEGCRNHARLSIEPTAKILTGIGIKGDYFNCILEAVAIHSYRNYEGSNFIAKILRDADKKDALGPFGLLRTSEFHLGKTFVDREEILEGRDNPKKIRELADKTLGLIKKDPLLSKKYLETGLSKVLEWVDKREFHTNSVYTLFAEDIEYTSKAREFLLF